MIGNVIAVAVIVGAMLTLSLLLFTQTKRAGSQQARGDVLAVRLEVALANTKTEAARADFQEKRANALDAAIVRAAARPIDGSFQLLAEREAANGASDGGRPGELRDAGDESGPTEALGPDDLLPFGA